MEGKQSCALCGVITLALLLVILLPMSFAYIDYWEYGLKQRKSTGKVYTDKVYAKGRYFVGPDYKFLKYQADAHLEHLEDVAVFSDGGEDSVGLSFLIDVDFTYFLKEDEIGKLHKDLAKTYAAVILSRTIDGIKNSATTVSFTDYFQNREGVELQFREVRSMQCFTFTESVCDGVPNVDLQFIKGCSKEMGLPAIFACNSGSISCWKN